jgi:hypothetical protein
MWTRDCMHSEMRTVWVCLIRKAWSKNVQWRDVCMAWHVSASVQHLLWVDPSHCNNAFRWRSVWCILQIPAIRVCVCCLREFETVVTVSQANLWQTSLMARLMQCTASALHYGTMHRSQCRLCSIPAGSAGGHSAAYCCTCG